MSEVQNRESRKKTVKVFSHIRENEKWFCVRVYNANHINEKIEILKSLKELINQFVDDKYNEFCIKFYNYLELKKNEIEYLIHYSYDDLNKPLNENDTVFEDFIDTYVYEDYKDINDKLIEIRKRIEIKFDCGFDDDNGNQICRIFEIDGSTELKDYTITAFIEGPWKKISRPTN